MYHMINNTCNRSAIQGKMVVGALCVGVWVSLLAFAGAQSCGNAGNSAVPFPGLPNQYAMDVEVNIEGLNYTVFLYELYDGIGKSARVEFFGSTSSTSIINYTTQTVYFVLAKNSCFFGTLVPPVLLSDIIQRSFEPYYFNGTIGISSVLDIYNLANSSAVYIGKDVVRGIPSDRWQSCVTSGSSTYLFDFYYSANGWIAPFNKNQVPLQLVISSPQNVTTHLFTFVDFNTGPSAVPSSAFAAPLGLVCQNRPVGKLLPNISQYFSVVIEIISSNFNAVRVFKSYYDYTSQLFLSEGFFQQNNRSSVLVEDFNTLTRYLVDKTNGQCVVNGIGPNDAGLVGYGVDSEAGTTVQMRTPQQFFLGVDDAAAFSFVYEGVTLIRDVMADAWITSRPFERFSDTVNLTNSTYEIFFTSPQWNVFSIDSMNVNPAIMRLQWAGILNTPSGSSNFSQYVDFVGFADVQPGIDVFDMSAHCQGPSDYILLTMMVPGSIKTADTGMLTGSIRQNFINFAQPLNVRPLQIGNVQVVGENNGQIVISLRVSNLTSFNPNVTLPSATSIVSALNAAMIANNGQFPFSVTVSAGNVVTPVIQPFPVPAVTVTVTATTTTTVLTTSPTVCPASASSSGLSSQGTVVLAICMVLIGILIVLGVLLVVCCVRRCSTSGPFALESSRPVSYKKHENELVY